MSNSLNPLTFPLHGARLIEASAGTGKTWTIAALYLRLVLGHGGSELSYPRPLQPSEILVMTFTRAATRELSERIRERLVEAAQVFRGKPLEKADPFLEALLGEYRGDAAALEQAAYRLMLAAEAMDESAVFTIDAWCQRVLREHAFDSGALFDEELIESERSLFSHAVRDYWRHHVYALSAEHFELLYKCWTDLDSFEKAVRDLVGRAHLLEDSDGGEPLDVILPRAQQRILAQLLPLKVGWTGSAAALKNWFFDNRAAIKANVYQDGTVTAFFQALEEWANDEAQILPGDGFYRNDAWQKWDAGKLTGAVKKAQTLTSNPPDDFARIAELKAQLDALPRLEQFILAHAAASIASRMQSLKAAARKFGFADMLSRLKTALEGENGSALRTRILARYPVALIDEFQDTSPDQYRIFDLLYEVAGDRRDLGLFLIGDPKQAIYGFRGADIHSYLAARRATEGRHYWLAKNFRSTDQVVKAVNQLFTHAEGKDDRPGHLKGAFGFRSPQENPLPFKEVAAHDRSDRLLRGGKEITAMTVWVGDATGYTSTGVMQFQFAQACAEQIVTLLNDPSVEFRSPQDILRLRPADIAILVKNRYEAAVVQQALRTRGVASVYLSDSDSVFKSEEAVDMLRWLHAISSPLDGALVRCALATRTADLPLAELASYTVDDLAWEARVEQLKALKQVWQRHGVLVMLRRFMHELRLPERLLVKQGGERSLTNLLHLAELLQRESQRLDGELALVRWLGEQIESSSEESEEYVLRLESDAQLVKIVTVHKSKGLEYPLVFLPFAAACRPVTTKNRAYFEYLDVQAGKRRIDFSLSDEVCQRVDQARLEEDIRLLYVALTRARHAIWIGVADVSKAFQSSALGYLANGGTPLLPGALKATIQEMCGDCPHIEVLDVAVAPGTTMLARPEEKAALRTPADFEGEFERDWAVASYSSITKSLLQTRSPASPAEQKIMEADEMVGPATPTQATSIHRFPRGAVPGLFIHGILEWMVEEGFDKADQPWYRDQLLDQCERSAWKAWKEDAADWLIEAVHVSLPPLNASLSAVSNLRAETEFWIPVDKLPTVELDRLCQERFFPELSRPLLSERDVSGMMHGFIDLVFEHGGRYWILDYKSTVLGSNDDAYHQGALQGAVVGKRYEVQGAIYLLALHRLLKTRLGSSYDPARQLGGALFFFLRGIGNHATRGACTLSPDLPMLEALDALLPVPQLELTE